MASPFLLAGGLAADLCGPGDVHEHIGWALFWTVIYGLSAVALLGVTLLTFNHDLGRVEYGLPRGIPRAVKPAKVMEIAGEPVDVSA